MSPIDGPRPAEIATLFGQETTPAGRRWLLRFSLGASALALAGLIAWIGSGVGSAARPRFTTAVIERGSLQVTVSATGELAPTHEVEVGSELSGRVIEVLVEETDPVRQGQLLVRLDTSRLEGQIARSRAALAAAEARARQAAASVAEARARLERLREVAVLSGGKVPSATELDAAVAAQARAEADTASAEASIGEAQAALAVDLADLEKATIRSPIDGIVLRRQVEPGQTVAASFQAPVLFRLARDLAQMELSVDIDEADVGQVKVGQIATFGVDTYPGRSYLAKIRRLGFGSETKDGVVSYRALLTVDNADLSLRPGMTATAEITTAVREGVLLVPNGALRFAPTAVAAAESSGSFVSRLLPRPPGPGRAEATDRSQLWVLEAGKPVALAVEVGVTDGRRTEARGDSLREGLEVLIAELEVTS